MDRPMESGTLVEIHGLKARPDLNGKRARVVTFASDRDRYQITVDGGEELYLKAVNLKVTDVGSTSGGAAAAKSAAPAPATVPTPGVSGTATLMPDTEVSISGLKARPDLNGLNGVVVAYVAERERYHVVVSDTKEGRRAGARDGTDARRFRNGHADARHRGFDFRAKSSSRPERFERSRRGVRRRTGTVPRGGK